MSLVPWLANGDQLTNTIQFMDDYTFEGVLVRLRG